MFSVSTVWLYVLALWTGMYTTHFITWLCFIRVYLLQQPVIITTFWLDVLASLYPPLWAGCGVLLFHWGVNIHWGSLTGQMTSSWFDRGVIISSKSLPPPLPSSFTPPQQRRSPPKHQMTPTALFLMRSVSFSGNKLLWFKVTKRCMGLAPINSLMNVSLHATITTHPPTHSLLTP